MSGTGDDGVPTQEQLDRIRRRVGERIERRRTVARTVVGSAAAVALLAGGVAVLPHLLLSSSGGSSASSARGGSNHDSAASSSVEVRCRATSGRSSASRAERAVGELPAAAVRACLPSAVEFQAGAERSPVRGGSPAPSTSAAYSPAAPASVAVVCRDGDGVIVVVPGDRAPATLCTRDGLQPY